MSEGSVSTSSSGIRQFGLYRTIDARTEEFLRLSRKRQIRQGCACAAISTAVTVTVVISLVLIYQYSITYESDTNTKQSWFNLMNKSADTTSFEANLEKAKINIDPIYLEFTPILINTLKKHNYFSKITEVHTTETPLYDKGDNTSNVYTTNIFSNWIRTPTSRVYTIEYKTSPIVYFKYPTRDINHFTKIRTIRDYQRVMNYVDKMINNKITITSPIPMLKNVNSFKNKFYSINYSSTTPMAKVAQVTAKKTKPRILKDHKKILKNNEKKSRCPCPKKINRLLSKLITNLQKIIPDFSEQKHVCTESKDTIKNNNTTRITKLQNNSIDGVAVTKSYRPSIPTINDDNRSITPNIFSNTFYSLTPSYPITEYTMGSIMRLLKLNNKFEPYYKNTTTRQYIEGTDENYYFPENVTLPMPKETSTIISSNIITVTDFILQKNDFHNISDSLVTFPIISEKVNEVVLTTPDIVNNFKDLDVQRIKIGGKGIIFNKSKTEQDSYKNLSNCNNKANEFNNTWHVLNMTDRLKYYTSKLESSNDSNWKSVYKVDPEIVTENEYFDINAELMSSQRSEPQRSSTFQSEQDVPFNEVTTQKEIDDTSEETIPEDNLRNLENLLFKINVSTIFERILAKNTHQETSKLDQVTNIAKQTANTSRKDSKSMIPESRSGYLEILRNNWKHDEEVQEYDNSINFLV